MIENPGPFDAQQQQLAEEYRITAVAALLLVVDDYYIYKQTGKAALPGLWEWMDNLRQSLRDGGNIKELVPRLESCPLDDLLGLRAMETKTKKTEEGVQ